MQLEPAVWRGTMADCEVTIRQHLEQTLKSVGYRTWRQVFLWHDAAENFEKLIGLK